MQLSGKRLKLVPFDQSDRDLFVEISMCPIMMMHVNNPSTCEEAEKLFQTKLQAWSLESGNWLSLSISTLLNNEKLGSIGLRIINHELKIAEVGFMIKQNAQGKGFAGEALELLINYAYSDLKLNKLTAICAVSNAASIKLLEKLGFTREDCLMKNTIINGNYVNDYIYGLCKSK